MIDIKTFAKPKKSAGASGGGSSTTYLVGVATEAEHATRADRAKKADSAERAAVADRATNAQSANYASKAGEVDAEAEVLQKFLRKDRVDDDHVEEVEGKVSFADDVMVNLLRSVDFSEILRRGFGFIKTASGGYRLLVTDLQVWGKAMFDQLEIRKLSSVGGNVVLSAASCKVAEVESIAISSGDAITKGWRCYFLVGEDDTIVENPWMVGDHTRCQTYGVQTGSRSYWRKVVEVSTDPVEKNGKRYHYVELSDDEGICTDDPMAGDTLVLDGHEIQEGESDTERTNLIMIESTGTGAPRIVGYSGIARYLHEDDNIVFAISPHDVTLRSESIRILNGNSVAALFSDGKINASLIDADQIEVKHLWAKSEDGTAKVGYFGNTEEDACKIGDTYAPLFVGADTAKNSPFYVTNKGHMVSKSATLGSFSLNESSLRYLTGYDDEEPGFALYNEYMVFRGYSRTFSPQTKKWTSERNRLIWVGRNDWVYSVPSLMSNILVQDSFPMTTGDTAKIGLRISVTGCDDKYQYENVMYNGAMGSNVYGNFAIYAENGMYAGFRPMTRRANYSMKLTELDCVIYVPVTGITLTLPDNPQRGQYYKFIQGSEGKQAFWIKSNSYKMYWNGVDTNGRTSFDSGACNQTTEFIFLGDHWRVNWYREAAI